MKTFDIFIGPLCVGTIQAKTEEEAVALALKTFPDASRVLAIEVPAE